MAGDKADVLWTDPPYGVSYVGKTVRSLRITGDEAAGLDGLLSADLNAFVERFQGTVLHLHYRTAFRYRFYTRARDVDADLQAWLRFYNFERPHRGYRTKGRRPAEIFYAERPALLMMKGWDVDEFTPQTVRS